MFDLDKEENKMEGKYKAEMVLKAWKPNGQLMASQTTTWEDMEYDDLVELECVLTKTQEALNDLGKKEAEKKKKGKV